MDNEQETETGNVAYNMVICGNGIDCKFLKRGTCNYIHNTSWRHPLELNNLIIKSNSYAIKKRSLLNKRTLKPSPVLIERDLLEQQRRLNLQDHEKKIKLIKDKEKSLMELEVKLFEKQRKINLEDIEIKRQITYLNYEFSYYEIRKKELKYAINEYDIVKKETAKFLKDTIEFKETIFYNASIQNYKKRIGEITNKFLCNVCMTPIKELIESSSEVIENNIDEFVILECGHTVCKCCVDNLQQDICPYCRTNFDKTKTKTNYLAKECLEINKQILSTNSIVLKELEINTRDI